MGDVTVKLNRAGIEELLRSSGVAGDLEARAERIAAAAGEGFDHEVEIGPSRARAAVWTATRAARRAEASDRALTSAVDAGRG